MAPRRVKLIASGSAWDSAAGPSAGSAGKGGTGDPVIHPRLTLRALAERVTDGAERAALWLSHAPKAKLYIDCPDFHFIRFPPLSGLLNAGFGKAYELDKKDLTLPPCRGDRFTD